MHKNTFKPLCMLAAITLAFGISTSSAHAADTDLSITQKIDKITGKESQQKYTINYTGENKNTALKIEYDRGFYAKELKVGDWDNYTGKIKVTAYTKDTKSPVMTTEADENATVSLENYSNIDWIEMNPAGDDGTQEDMTETQNIKDVDLSGTIYAGKSGKTVQVKGSVWLDDTYSGNAVCEKVITTTANDYTVASPYVQVNPDQVNYLGSTAMTIKNLQGSLKAGQLNSYHVTFNIPARMFVDSITLPKFDNASYKLYVNGNQMDTRNSKIYVNDKAANISMDITPNGDFFSQSQDMVIDMRNTVNQSGDNKVSVSVLAVCGNGCEFKADSNAMPIKYQEQTVKIVQDDNGNDIVKTTEWEPEATQGSIDVEIPVTGKKLAGRTLVVFEEIYLGDAMIACHKDINDANQTIKIKGYRDCTVIKRIKADDYWKEHGDPTFIFKLTGTDTLGAAHTYYQSVTFTENYVKAHTDSDGYVEMKAVFGQVPAGEYTCSEESVSRFEFESLTKPVNATINGKTAVYHLTDNDTACATFTNKKYEEGDFGHDSVVVNHFNHKTQD